MSYPATAQLADAALMSAPGHASVAAAVAWTDLVAHRSYLVRYAQRRLQDPMLAEEVVEDVL